MGLFTKRNIRTLGIAFTTLVLIIAGIAVILAGVDYDLAGVDFKLGHPWYALDALQIASSVYAFIVSFIGYIVFCRPNIGCTIAYTVFIMTSLLFNIAIAILNIVAGNYGWVNTYFGCNGKFGGVLGMWQGIDSYLKQVDQNFCGPSCPCFIKNSSGFTTNSTLIPYYNQWTKSNGFPRNTNFQNCSVLVQSQTYSQAAKNDYLFDQDRTFNTVNFANYMQIVENKFKCAGWCNVTYFNTDTNQNTAMFKYNFNDINNGPVQHLGCLDQLINYLPEYYLAFGSVTLVLAGFQICVFALSLCQCLSREKDHINQIPHHHDDNRQ